jgi:hypothetical protein
VPKNKRVVIEVSEQVHGELRRLAAFNDLRLYLVADAVLRDVLQDEEHVKAVVRRLKL